MHNCAKINWLRFFVVIWEGETRKRGVKRFKVNITILVNFITTKIFYKKLDKPRGHLPAKTLCKLFPTKNLYKLSLPKSAYCFFSTAFAPNYMCSPNDLFSNDNKMEEWADEERIWWSAPTVPQKRPLLFVVWCGFCGLDEEDMEI